MNLIENNIKLNQDWQTVLSKEINAEYFEVLITAVAAEYENYTCFPPRDLIFAAFNHCSFDEIKVVIIGQDPYHGENEANGLCFSVNDGIKIPPSLRNIFKEINSDLETVFMPTSGNLERWAKQGVLLLNNSLTVRKDQANSHKHLDWKKFMDAVIEKISLEKTGVVFLLWGKFAQQKGAKIDRAKHLVLEAVHPSPMGANQGGWFGSKHFSQANGYLNSIGKAGVEW
jgi:uracil-DNA glycosylase